MKANKTFTWSDIYDPKTRGKLRPAYRELLRRLAHRFGCHVGEVENEIYWVLTPSINPKRRAHKRPFASMQDLERYLGKTLLRIFYKRIPQKDLKVSLDAVINEDGKSLSELLACPEVDRSNFEQLEWRILCLEGMAQSPRDEFRALAAALLARRDDDKIRQEDLARELGIKQCTVSRQLGKLAARINCGLEQ